MIKLVKNHEPKKTFPKLMKHIQQFTTTRYYAYFSENHCLPIVLFCCCGDGSVKIVQESEMKGNGFFCDIDNYKDTEDQVTIS